MDNKNDKAEYKRVGWYAVVHYGTPKDRVNLPLFLRDNLYNKMEEGLPATYLSFTADMARTRLFNNIYDAEQAKRKVVESLASREHPLKDHIEVIELFGQVIRRIEEE